MRYFVIANKKLLNTYILAKQWDIRTSSWETVAQTNNTEDFVTRPAAAQATPKEVHRNSSVAQICRPNASR